MIESSYPSGPVIIQESKEKRGGFQLKLNIGQTVKLPRETVFRHRMFEGQSFSPMEWLQILEEAEEEVCFEKAMNILGARFHARRELIRKLYQRKYRKKTIDKVLARCEELGLIDDLKFARLYIEEKLEFAKQPKRKIFGDLRRKGVPKAVLDELSQELEESFSRDAMLEQALEVGRRRFPTWRREKDPQKCRDKILRFLAGRGYGQGVCFDALRQLQKELHAEDGSADDGLW